MFTFTLQSVLEQRKNAEDRLQKELAHLDRQLQAQKAALNDLRARRSQCSRSLQQSQCKGISIGDARIYMSFLERTDRKIEAAVEALNQLRAQHHQKRLQVLEAVKQRKAMEKLKERKYRQWRKAQNRREQAQLDEAAVARFNRRNNLAL